MVHLTGPDAETIAVYDAKRLDYEKMVAGKRESGNAVALAQQAARTSFLDGLPPNAVILDYGCGPGMYVVFVEKPSPPWFVSVVYEHSSRSSLEEDPDSDFLCLMRSSVAHDPNALVCISGTPRSLQT